MGYGKREREKVVDKLGISFRIRGLFPGTGIGGELGWFTQCLTRKGRRRRREGWKVGI